MKRGHFRSLYMVLLVVVVVTFAMPGRAFCGEKVVLTLDEAVRKAILVNTEIKEAEFETEVYRSKKAQADGARYPQIELIAYGSLSPRARLKSGQVESSTNINKESYDGVFGRADIQLVQPIYTFGRISAYRDAAGHAVTAYEAGAKLKATEVRMLVNQAYYGLLLGKEMKLLLADIKEQLDKAVDKVQKQLDADAPGVDQVGLLKLQTYQGELAKYDAMADEGIAKAKYGLKTLTNLPEDADVDVADEYLMPAEINMEDYETYRNRAMKDRLEFIQLSEGLSAKESLIKAQYSEYLPQVFVAVMYSLAGATNRDHLNNPYITDEFNHNYGGLVVGFKWNYDFMKSGKTGEAKAEYMKLLMKKYTAEGGIPFQVKDAYLHLEECNRELEALSQAYKSAKQWAVASTSNFDLGIGEPRDIAESVDAYARLRADYYRAIYNQRMAIVNLQHATGEDASAVPYSTVIDPYKELQKLEIMCNGGKK